MLLLVGRLTLNVLHHTIPHGLCRGEVKYVHGLQSFISTHSEESDSSLFHSLFVVANAFSICIFEREFSYFFRRMGLVFKVFTTSTRRFRVNLPATC